MSKMTAIILGGGRGTRLDPLTKMRSKPAVPIGGKFRLIDIPLSNCLHAGVRDVFILTQFNTQSLHQHISSTYIFDNFSRGAIRILAAQQTMEISDWYQGTADAVRKNLSFFEDAEENIIILSGDHLYRMDYSDFLAHHVKNKADISIAVKPVFEHEASELGILKANKKGLITSFYEKPTDKEVLEEYKIAPELFDAVKVNPEGRTHIASMGIYIFKKEALFELLENNKKEDFGKEIIPDSIKEKRLVTYFFDGYWEDIGTIRAFFDVHMELTAPIPKFNFYDEQKPIFTHPRYLPASKINNCQINHSVVAEGCIIMGSIIENSVIGIRSYIEEGTLVQKSIIMGSQHYETIEEHNKNKVSGKPNMGIGKNCVIRNAIIDMNCSIGDNVHIINKDGRVEAEESFYRIRDGIVIIPKGTIVPDNTII
ncbi:MAG: glucose-1-phosphate adenylyltransferase [Calditrichaeota bacterium]|nr:MAG: glucose-1-phosphate adenylyltransferase [Calditrichota bacterium]MBL1205536.1 glucose-1-phosphate adenylyltransferase [Calditrichota bacterium]NOG45365.1 glucose-1-phosphate adenylyltransferase [Calditrichota bacterium]